MAKMMGCVSEILFGLRPHPEDLRGEAQLGRPEGFVRYTCEADALGVEQCHRGLE